MAAVLQSRSARSDSRGASDPPAPLARLSADDGQLRLEVSDDGPGFDVAAVNGGVGLRNMEDRLGAVRGRLEITTSPGEGTLIIGVVPISAPVP